MLATHRVIDSNGNTAGFIVDNKFYTDYYIKENVDYVDNIALRQDGTLCAANELPVESYKNIVIQKEYTDIVTKNPIKRDIENTLVRWKNEGARQILQIGGARQIGKTTEIKKFAYSNYEYVIYVNLATDEFDFKSCVKNGSKPLEFEKYCQRAGLPHFVDSSKTILIIDEIQTNTHVFNSLRSIQENVNCHIIITGSYLGRYLGFMNHDKEENVFFSMGNIEPIEMFNMSFQEFCAVFEQDKLLQNISLYGESPQADYTKLNELYNLYCLIGGYPSVVSVYVKTHNIGACYEEMRRILYVFQDESGKYFTTPKQTEVFSKVYRQAVYEMLSEKRGNGKNIVENITNFVKDSAKDFVSRDEVSEAIVWLKKCNMISTCSMIEKNNFAQKQYNRRMYFMDCGIASYIMNDTVVDESSRKGLLAETFVFCELNRLYHTEYANKKVKDELCFSICSLNNKKYELDFVVVGKGENIENVVFGIEVKANRGNHESLNVYLDNRYVDKGVLAKNTKGGHADKFDTIPIYTVGCRFPYSK